MFWRKEGWTLVAPRWRPTACRHGGNLMQKELRHCQMDFLHLPG